MNRRRFIQNMTAAVAVADLGSLPMKVQAAGQVGGAQLPGLFRFGDGRDWFFEKRFGMFVHWGLYSIPGWHEQHQWRKREERAEYGKLAQQWNPVEFNPNAWLDLAESAGMRYLCVTTKHHDGFCLWDTKATTFSTMKPPFGKDVLRMLSDACHQRDFPLCLYYSIADWHNPNYPNQGRHHELPPQSGDRPDLIKYTEFVKTQVRELCSNYGQIHGFWWDMNVDQYRDRSINDLIRRLQPDAVINNRGYDEGDFGTPEREFEKDEDAVLKRPTEACNSIGIESWGYRSDEDFYSDGHLLRSLDRYLARGANYLLNVGPTGAGAIPPEADAMLRRIGVWYNAVKESFLDAEPAPGLTTNRNVLLTRRGNTIYVHLCRVPVAEAVKLNPMRVAPKSAILLNDGRPVEFAVDLVPSEHVDFTPCLRLRKLPVNEMSNSVLVVKLEFDRPILPDVVRAGAEPDARVR